MSGLVLGHEVFDSSDGALCTTVEQRVVLVLPGRAPLPPHPPGSRRRRPRVEWDPPARSPGPSARADERLHRVGPRRHQPREVDVLGVAGFPAYIHRFSAANGQVLAAFGMTPAYMRTSSVASPRSSSSSASRRAPRGRPRARAERAPHVGNSSLRILHRMTVPDGRGGRHPRAVRRPPRPRRAPPRPAPCRVRARAPAMLVAPAPRRDRVARPPPEGPADLHCGDCAAAVARRAGLPGQVRVWRKQRGRPARSTPTRTAGCAPSGGEYRWRRWRRRPSSPPTASSCCGSGPTRGSRSRSSRSSRARPPPRSRWSSSTTPSD